VFLIILLTSTLVGAFFFITFWAYRKHQLGRLEQGVIEKQDEILMAVTSFRSLLNLESYISKGEYEVTIEGRRASKEETETPFMDWVRTQESSNQ
jgi:hypothetical protein